MSDRRIVIEIEPLSPRGNSETQFPTHYTAEASLKVDDEDGTPTTRAFSVGVATEPYKAAMGALEKLGAKVSPPNAHFCHTPLACVLSGRCEKQFGPSGTSCCD